MKVSTSITDAAQAARKKTNSDLPLIEKSQSLVAREVEPAQTPSLTDAAPSVQKNPNSDSPTMEGTHLLVAREPEEPAKTSAAKPKTSLKDKGKAAVQAMRVKVEAAKKSRIGQKAGKVYHKVMDPVTKKFSKKPPVGAA